LTKIDIQYNKATNDLGQCNIIIDDSQVHELLQHFETFFSEELQQASFAKQNEQTVISFRAAKAKILWLEEVIPAARKAIARLN